MDADAERSRTLLLVDDEEYILSSLKRLLRRDGYRLLACNSPEAALETLSREAVDVILSDQRMPSMTGTDFLRQVKDRYPDTVRMVLSGYTDLQSVTDAINQGAIYKFLTKPWDDEQLRANIAEAFRRKDIVDENRRLTAELQAANETLQGLVAERERQATQLRVALETTQEIVQITPWPVIGVDEDGMIALSNSGADALLGGGVPLIGMPAADTLPEEIAACFAHPDRIPAEVGLQGRRYRVVCKPMGQHSLSRGRLLALLPCEPCQ